MKSHKTSQLSRIFGCFASTNFPYPLQVLINKLYVFCMKVDLTSFENAAKYPTLNALFTRELKVKRHFDEDEETCISPCDAYVSEAGTIEHTKALQIKGFAYKVNELLGNYVLKREKDKLEGGTFINFYLSPKDYHRYHVPVDMQIIKAVHIPGKLYPVNFTWLKKVPSLFVENERVVLECETKEAKRFFLVFVGALNVGKMVFTFDANIQTNAKDSLTEQYYTYESLWLRKGEELGHFEMGSTIVALFEKEALELTKDAQEPVRFGEVIGRF